MGNVPSKSDFNDSSGSPVPKKLQIHVKPSSESREHSPQSNRFPFNNSSGKKRSVKIQEGKTVSPVRHQFVTADQATPLTSLSAPILPKSPRHSPRSIYAQLKRHRGSHDSQSESSIISEDAEPPQSSRVIFFKEVAAEKSAGLNHCVIPFGAERERDRQTREHYILKQIFKGNYHVELENPKKILDSACGVGLWSLEMGIAFPDCEIIGIDILSPSEKYGQGLAKATSAGQINNVQFQYEDICQPTLSFSDSTFDFVFQRDVGTFMSYERWPNLMKEFYRIVKPGGKIQLVEYDIKYHNPGPVLTIINEWYIAACAVSGVRSDYASFIPEFMESSGFVNINREEFNVPIGEWPTDGSLI
ncbi:hypothetical protein G6F46_011912 [Rhizopus delemar]|uniref:Methyltransferase domain-containing protein n=2 Tax=Rhizopus TaxID=4842 RepID=A0A9P7CSS9_9FUNG|nr:hypothetical protein G6F55_011541 [Rhizopus delemar]KAG1534616.1 hypothetical protein G6F51_011997 [Rhizopus arrhizus]KAG1489049.1 hypothetical protein G6F54_011717 [Rhizopus delemar]KAG1512051.1 hypothetical protein G6F52_010503 [Rhizopus delemar]KAG1516021.1 hypothetical protein G6F53_002472 [Rhizopus delemar]